MSSVISIPRGTFTAHCPQCSSEMDLLAAPWCGCATAHPSKLCSWCETCACSHPDYGNPICWEEAPPGLRRFGFTRLFTPYVSGTRKQSARQRA